MRGERKGRLVAFRQNTSPDGATSSNSSISDIMAAPDISDENTRPAEVSLPSTKQQQKPSSGNRIGANGVILGPDGKPCKVRAYAVTKGTLEHLS